MKAVTFTSLPTVCHCDSLIATENPENKGILMTREREPERGTQKGQGDPNTKAAGKKASAMPGWRHTNPFRLGIFARQ